MGDDLSDEAIRVQETTRPVKGGTAEIKTSLNNIQFQPTRPVKGGTAEKCNLMRKI